MRYLILLLLITSCASRKVNVSKEDIKTIVDSTSIVKTDSVSTINNNIKLVENSEELEIRSLVDSLPLVIDGKTYFNAVLRYKKSNKVLTNNSNKTVHKSASKYISKSKQETKSVKNKNIDKKTNYFVYLWLLLIPIGMYIYRQIKIKLLL